MSRLPLGAALVAMVLVGCGQTPASFPEHTVPMPAPDAAKAAAPAATGTVELRVAGLGGYKVQATTSEVAALRVTLSGGALSEPLVQTASAAGLASGRGTITFAAVPAGTMDVAIAALDGEGFELGATATTAEVTAGETAVVAATLTLAPTHVTAAGGSVAFDLTVQDGAVIVDPIATASLDPASPVLSPAPSPLPTVAPEVAVLGKVLKTWYGDGTLGVQGTVRNTFPTTRRVKVTVTFTKKTLFGTKVVETVERDLDLLKTKGTKTFDVRSSEKVTTWRGEGDAEVTVSHEDVTE